MSITEILGPPPTFTKDKRKREYQKYVISAFKGKTHTEDTKELLSKLRRERIENGTVEGHRVPHTEESKRKMSEVKKGKVLTEEHKKKISEAGRGRVFSNDSKMKMSMAKKGKPFTEEHKMALRAAKQRVKNGI